ncbi:MAG: hypothetical protein H6869_04670 [Rhodospirillales bacterium]|nr:hypothetical protein [Rhodospirillales bacterium]
MLRIALGTILLAAGMASMAFAETPPLPQRKAQSLETVQQDLKHKRASQMSLERKMSEVKADLEKTRQELVSIAQDVQKNEAELSRLEESIAKRSAEENP